MKTKRLLISCVLLLACSFNSGAQTAAAFIAQGRGFLAVSNLASANLSFSNALVVSPADPTANVFYAATRLLVLPSQPVSGAFLTRLGLPVSGRNIYKWTARLPKDTKGLPLAPAGVNANEATALLRTNILAEMIGAEANLAMVTDTNFTLALTAQDTASMAVTLDYGDIQLLRSMLDGFEYFIYNTYDWNLDAQLTALRALETNTFSLGGFLGEFPGLLTFSTTNDLKSAQSAFVKGENSYVTASKIIRARPPGTMRLFNYDAGKAQEETKFRLTLSDLAASLTNGPVILEADSALSVFMPPAFSGAHSLRSFFPQIYGNGFVAGSLPDASFGGVIIGLSNSVVEQRLAKNLKPIPAIAPASGPTVQFQVHSVIGRGYVVQSSSDLLNWSNVTAFVATTPNYSFTDPAGHNQPRRFYRVVDSTGHLPPPPNDNFADRIPLTGLGIQVTGYNNNATTENNEPVGFGYPSIWWSWTATSTGTVIASTAGSQANTEALVYTGTAINNLSDATSEGADPNLGYSGPVFDAVAGTTYQIQVLGIVGQEGVVQLEISTPPILNVSSPIDGTELPAASNITILASASDAHSQIASVSYDVLYYDFFGGSGEFSASNPGSSINFTLTNALSGYYDITEVAVDNLGLSVSEEESVTVDP